MGEVFLFLDDIERVLHEPLDQIALTRLRRVDGYDEIANALRLLVFQRLDERHVAVQLQAIGIEHVVVFVVVDLHLFGEHGEPTQKLGVVVTLAVGHLQRGDERASLVAPFLRERFQVHLNLLGDFFPVALLLRFLVFHLALEVTLRRLPLPIGIG